MSYWSFTRNRTCHLSKVVQGWEMPKATMSPTFRSEFGRQRQMGMLVVQFRDRRPFRHGDRSVMKAGPEPERRHRKIDVVGDIALADGQDRLVALRPALHIGPDLQRRRRTGAESVHLRHAVADLLEHASRKTCCRGSGSSRSEAATRVSRPRPASPSRPRHHVVEGGAAGTEDDWTGGEKVFAHAGRGNTRISCPGMRESHRRGHRRF